MVRFSLSTLAGEIIELDADPQIKVFDLKRLVAERVGVVPMCQKLILPESMMPAICKSQLCVCLEQIERLTKRIQLEDVAALKMTNLSGQVRTVTSCVIKLVSDFDLIGASSNVLPQPQTMAAFPQQVDESLIKMRTVRAADNILRKSKPVLTYESVARESVAAAECYQWAIAAIRYYELSNPQTMTGGVKTKIRDMSADDEMPISAFIGEAVDVEVMLTIVGEPLYASFKSDDVEAQCEALRAIPVMWKKLDHTQCMACLGESFSSYRVMIREAAFNTLRNVMKAEDVSLDHLLLSRVLSALFRCLSSLFGTIREAALCALTDVIKAGDTEAADQLLAAQNEYLHWSHSEGIRALAHLATPLWIQSNLNTQRLDTKVGLVEVFSMMTQYCEETLLVADSILDATSEQDLKSIIEHRNTRSMHLLLRVVDVISLQMSTDNSFRDVGGLRKLSMAIVDGLFHHDARVRKFASQFCKPNLCIDAYYQAITETLLNALDTQIFGFARCAAAEALGEFAMYRCEDERIVLALLSRLNDPDVSVICAAMRALSSFSREGSGQSIATLKFYLRHQDSWVRQEATKTLCTLAEIGDADAIMCCLSCLQDPDWAVVKAALLGAARLAPCDALDLHSELYGAVVHQIAALLKHHDGFLRKEAADSLAVVAQRNDLRVLDALQKCRDDWRETDPEVLKSVDLAIKSLAT